MIEATPRGEALAPPLLVEDEAALAAVAAAAARARRVSLDTEANGLFVHRARACVVQLAFRGDDGRVVVAIVDALRTPLAPLADLLAPGGPEKLLHDLTFDVRLLGDAGLRVGNVRDTEVMARLLGRRQLGLAALLEAELGLALPKGLQRHDWARRPLARAHLDYLAGDVAHLEDLFERLDDAVAALDLAPEVEEETRYKLDLALEPPAPPVAWTRIAGATALDGPGRAALRSLSAAREVLAAARDVPEHQIAPSAALLALARARPLDRAGLDALLGRDAGAGDVRRALLDALDRARGAIDAPEEETRDLLRPAPPREELARRRRIEQAVSAWRRREAAARGVSEQAVLPGHCARDLAARLAGAETPDEARAAAAAVRGVGGRRLARSQDAWVALWSATR